MSIVVFYMSHISFFILLKFWQIFLWFWCTACQFFLTSQDGKCFADFVFFEGLPNIILDCFNGEYGWCLQVKFTAEGLRRIMDFKHNIRNMSVIAHVDHGMNWMVFHFRFLWKFDFFFLSINLVSRWLNFVEICSLCCYNNFCL